MFARLPDVTAAAVAITIDGVAFVARDGDTVAAALLAAGTVVCRTTPVAGAPRGPYCMMGACFDCLVEVDECPNVRGCMTRVAPGMRIVTRRAERRV
jgi:predicted molibdopterin-dependent oxidoreductase YjgC